MPPFKEHLSPDLVGKLIDEIGRAWTPFDAPAFRAVACDGLDQLELKARAAQIADALRARLPTDIGELTDVVVRLLDSDTFAGWMLWPFTDAVGLLAQHDPERGLALMRLLTPRWTAEGAIRPFIDRHPTIAFPLLLEWTDDPDEHVRRLVSEGTRPRLPWSPQLRALIADPSPSIPLLDRLYDDPSEYVRRSVANHLNDIAKDHPAVAVTIAERWRDLGGEHVGRVVRHGLRSLVKAGDPAALAAIGATVDAPIELLTFTVEPTAITIGASVEVHGRVASPMPAEVEIDLRVHYANVAGALTRRKTFKLARRTIPAGGAVDVRRSFRFAPVSIRALFPGTHLLELLANGRVVATTEIELHG